MYHLCTFSVALVTLSLHSERPVTTFQENHLSFHWPFFFCFPFKVVFRKFDLDKSGSMSAYEMRMALESAGNSEHFMLIWIYRLLFDSVTSYLNLVVTLDTKDHFYPLFQKHLRAADWFLQPAIFRKWLCSLAEVPVLSKVMEESSSKIQDDSTLFFDKVDGSGRMFCARSEAPSRGHIENKSRCSSWELSYLRTELYPMVYPVCSTIPSKLLQRPCSCLLIQLLAPKTSGSRKG